MTMLLRHVSGCKHKAEGASLLWRWGLGPSLRCGSRCPAPCRPKSGLREGQGRRGSHGDSMLPQGRWVSRELCHSTRTHMYTHTREPWSREC